MISRWFIAFSALAAVSQIASAVVADPAPHPSLPCFPGAHYRKAVSSQGPWAGIEGVITLPKFTPDPARMTTGGRFMDNASIYMGGLAGDQEIDCGLSWEVVREPGGGISKHGKAFRIFWRNKVWGSGPSSREFSYAAGDTIAMSVVAPTSGSLTLTVQRVGRADGSTTGVEPVFTKTFPAPNFGPGVTQEFKRVNAIDQRGNEGRPTTATMATALGARWRSVDLLRAPSDSDATATLRRIPFTPDRFTDMRCPDPATFRVETLPGGGEIIDIGMAAPAARRE